MCFSAQASFGASAILVTIGIVSVSKSTNVPQKVLSSIPFIFGIQQFAEGILWLSLSRPGFSEWNNIAIHTFLFFAEVVWPTIVPLSVMLLEKDPRNKKILAAALALGIFVSLSLAYFLSSYSVGAQISCSHIMYDLHYPAYLKNLGFLYLIATVFPPIISTIKRLRLLGVVIFASYIITRIFYQDYLISVWCFFAAIISVVALSVIIKLNEAPKPINKVMQG